jgi:C_GCAxxG_C_C family probable redox protein
MNHAQQQNHEQIAHTLDVARQDFMVRQLNCAESTFGALARTLNLSPDEALVRIATPFGGGIADSRSMCGALIAAIMALGLRLGRTEPDTPRKLAAYERARTLRDRFVAEAGGEMCRELNPEGFDRPDLRPHCLRFVLLAARLAATDLVAGEPEVDPIRVRRG